jgi:hypothetical protein
MIGPKITPCSERSMASEKKSLMVQAGGWNSSLAATLRQRTRDKRCRGPQRKHLGDNSDSPITSIYCDYKYYKLDAGTHLV